MKAWLEVTEKHLSSNKAMIPLVEDNGWPSTLAMVCWSLFRAFSPLSLHVFRAYHQYCGREFGFIEKSKSRALVVRLTSVVVMVSRLVSFVFSITWSPYFRFCINVKLSMEFKRKT